MTINKIVALLAICLTSSTGYSQVVNNETELNDAISAATPGTTITLANGTWKDVFIDIDKNGTLSDPITIMAQNAGAVLMTGNSRVYMEGNYLTVSGLVFQDPENLVGNSSEIEPVIELKRCNNCKVLNNKIDTYNGTEAQKDIKFKWILADGQYNEIAYNSFLGKYGIGSIINDNRNSTEPDYLKIHHNYFAGRRPINEVNEDNDQDAIRIGNSSTSLDDSFSEVYSNYFYDFAGEVEVISNKSGQNKYYNNTFRDYSGTLTLRHGNNCEVYGNFFIADDRIFSGGVRVIGEGHKIYNNYIEGINYRKPSGSGSNATGGINVTNGRLNSALNGYYQVKNAQIVNNTFVNCDYALRVGTTVSSDLDQEPINLTVANNIMYNSSIDDYEIKTAPSGTSISEGNLTGLPSEAMEDDGNLHVLTDGSSPIDAGIGNYSFLTQDMFGGTRDANFDAGAEEFGAEGTLLPFTSADVGFTLGFGGISNSISSSSPDLSFGVCGSTLSFNVLSNVDWTINNNLSWLSFDQTSGSGSQTITATVLENVSGVERSGTFEINEIIGGSDASFEMSATQLLISVPFEIPISGATTIGMQDKEGIAIENAYDDNKTTYWTGDPDTEPEVSITFDLGDSYFLTSMGINFWKADERTTEFSIEIADDASGPFTTIIESATSADDGSTVDTEQKFKLNGSVARYVKFIGIGNSSATNWTSIANINIYGDTNCANATSIQNHQQSDTALTVFPNPVSDGILNIITPNKPTGPVKIFNTNGQLVFSYKIIDSNSSQIDVTGLKQGLYFIKIKESGLVKFIVK